MAYTKQIWTDGESAVNADRMNHIEEGIAGAAPSGYGMGEILWDNMIKDPLDTSLKTGVYGMWDGLEGFTNFPETNFVGYCEIHNFNNEWHSAIAHNLVSGEIFYNLYAPGIPWSGWVRTSTKVIDLPPVSHPETVTLKAPNDAPMVFQKCGNHVILNEYLNFSTNLSSWGTIPEGLRPKKLVVFQIAHNNGNAYIGIAPPSGMLYSDQMIPAGVLAYNLDYYI